MLLLVLLCSASPVATANIYYAATNGANSNTGLSTNSPWPLAYALGNAGTSNSIIVMPGTYSGEVYSITNSYLTLKSQIKWAARLTDSPGVGIKVGSSAGPILDGVVIDGLTVSNALNDGIVIYDGSNNVIRNCWVLRTGQFAADGNSWHSGIWVFGNNCLVENNLSEYNGATATQDHGFYLGGTNMVVRNNIARHNCAYGMQLYSHSPDSVTGLRLYNNLVYGNYVRGGVDPAEMVVSPGYNTTTNWVFCNTFITTNPYAIKIAWISQIWFTNNIIISSSNGFYPYGTAHSDYNLAPTVLHFPGPHDIVTNYFGFVNSKNGRYWLAADSPARGNALSTAYGPVDFFGHAQRSVTDIGAFQYSAAISSDSRVLDPSPPNPDYWTNLGGTSLSFAAPSGSITSPLVATNGYIYQPLQTGITNGGQAVYNFAVTIAGSYLVQASINAPSTGANSFYLNVDAQPQDPAMIWDVPVTTGFEQHTVSWRGNGSDTANQFVPQIFHLAAGAHQLIIIGRGANTQLEQLSILKVPAAPQNLRVASGQ